MTTCRSQIAFTLLLLTAAASSTADEVVTFATGGYANQLRTPKMMHKIDTDRDGMVSKTEWGSYQQKLFAMIDADGSGALDTTEFMHAHRNDVVSFATGGFANALRTSEMFAKLDADGDRNVSRDEFVAYHSKMFDAMDSRRTGVLGQNEFFGRGPAR